MHVKGTGRSDLYEFDVPSPISNHLIYMQLVPLQCNSLGVYLKNIFGPLLHEVPTIMTLGRVGIVHLPYYHAV